MMFAVLLMKLFDWVISDNDPRQNNHLSQIGYSTLKSPHIMHNASQLRRFVINSLAFELFTTESYIFKSNIWSSYITLDKPKVTKGIVSAKLVKYLLLINSSQKPYFSK